MLAPQFTTTELQALSDTELTAKYIRLMRAETVPHCYRVKPTAESRRMHHVRANELKAIRLLAAERQLNIDKSWREDCAPKPPTEEEFNQQYAVMAALPTWQQVLDATHTDAQDVEEHLGGAE